MLKRNEIFICSGCGTTVPQAKKTSRNHCNLCFLSMHVDEKMPGDRMSACEGKMIPYEYVIANGKIKVHFICVSCFAQHWNKTASDDEVAYLDTYIASWRKKYPNVIDCL